MIETITDIILNVTGFQLILLVFIVLCSKIANNHNKILLAGFLLSKSFLIVRWMVYRYGILSYTDDMLLYKVSCSVFFVLAPLVFLYIYSLCYKSFRIKLIHLLHSIPFLLFMVYSVFSYYIQNNDVNINRSINWIFVENYWRIFWLFNLMQIFIYIIFIFNTIQRFRIRIKNIFTEINKINLNWLFSLLILISCHWLFVATRSLISIINTEARVLIQLIDIFSITIFLVFTTILVIRGLHQIKMFPGIDYILKINGSKIDKMESEKYISELNSLINSEKPYLTPSLTIDELSEMLSIQSWKLSYLINHNYNKNFYNFINGYRIEEFKERITNPVNKKKTILELIYEVSFNSKSSFNDVFKKQTGMTPSQYKKHFLNNLLKKTS